MLETPALTSLSNQQALSGIKMITAFALVWYLLVFEIVLWVLVV